MRVFKTKTFARWAAKQDCDDASLRLAIEEIEKGLVDADLGGNVYKKRVRRPGAGKRGSYRTLIAYRIEDRAFFVFGFAKNVRGNVNDKELAALKVLAAELLGYDGEQLTIAINAGELIEVTSDD